MTGCCDCATTVDTGSGAEGLDLLSEALDAGVGTEDLELVAAA